MKSITFLKNGLTMLMPKMVKIKQSNVMNFGNTLVKPVTKNYPAVHLLSILVMVVGHTWRVVKNEAVGN